MPVTLANFKRRPCQILTASFAGVIIIGQIVIAGPILDWALKDSMKGPATQWSGHLYSSLEKSRTMDNSAIDAAGAIGGAIGTGTIHHLDLLRGGHQLTIGSVTDTELLAKAIEHLFTSDTEEITSFGQDAGHRTTALSARLTPVADQSAEFTLIEEATGERAVYFGSAVFTRTIAGEAVTMRLVIDLTTTAASQKLLLSLASIIFTFVSTAVIGVAARIAYKSREAEQMSDMQARYLAERDPLTGLFNRYGFGVRAEALLDECAQKQRTACLIQFDANKFKDINDLHGHPAGDEVLRGIADMIKSVFPDTALAARLGGDEFAVLVRESELNGDGAGFLQKLSTRTTIRLGETRQKLIVSTSAGFAVFPRDGRTLVELMKAADLALYSVKQSAKASIGGYRPDMTKALEKRLWEIDGIREAVAAGQIEPFYQPLVNARTKEIEGLEALVRWNNPAMGVLAPLDFSNALTDPAASLDITRAMLTRITRDVAKWRQAGHDICASLNIGETDLKQRGLQTMLKRALDENNLPPQALSIEVTESAVNPFNIDEFIPVLQNLRSMGMSIGLDDFGTGSSSISLLKRLPCTAVKIDKSFVRGMLDQHDDLSIVRALIRLAHDLDIKVVAEGVESTEQSRRLEEMGCDLLQGYLYSAPVSADRIADFLSVGGLTPQWGDWHPKALSA